MQVDVYGGDTLVLVFKGEECGRIKDKINLKVLACRGYSGSSSSISTEPYIFDKCFIEKGYKNCGGKTEKIIEVLLTNIEDVFRVNIIYETTNSVPDSNRAGHPDYSHIFTQ